MEINLNGKTLIDGHFPGVFFGSMTDEERTVQTTSYPATAGLNIPADFSGTLFPAILSTTGSRVHLLIHGTKGSWKLLQHFCSNITVSNGAPGAE